MLETVKIIRSDLSGAKDAAPVTLWWDGHWWEVDLTAPEQQNLGTALDPFLSVARRVRRGPSPRNTTVPTHLRLTEAQRVECRSWARSEGFEVADRGRIPAEIVEAYLAAHPHIRGTDGPAETA